MMTADFSKGLPDLRAGIYRHWKGPLYQVLGYAHDANADDLYSGEAMRNIFPGSSADQLQPLGERMVVVYFGLELDDAHQGPRLAVRSVDDFMMLVCRVTGTRFDDCQCLPLGHQPDPVARFTYVAAQ